MNIEEIQKIVNEAPEGATHVEVEECGGFTFYQHDIEENHWSEYKASSGNFKIGISELIVESICNLNDLREILQLRTLLEQVTRAADVVLAHPAEPAYRKNLDDKVADVRGVL